MKSGIREIFACGIRNPEIWNPGNFCSWNPESGKVLLVKSGIRKIFAREIRNPGNFCLWNPNPWLWNQKYSLRYQGILLTISIPNPGSTEK